MVKQTFFKLAYILLCTCFLCTPLGCTKSTKDPSEFSGLTKQEQKIAKATQGKLLKETEENLLHFLKNPMGPPYPFDRVIQLIEKKRAVAKLAQLINDSRFQSKMAHIQILNALEQLQIDGAGEQIATLIKKGTYKQDSSMMLSVVNALSPLEIKKYKKLLIPLLKDKNILLKTLVASRLATVGVSEGEIELAALIAKPNRYIEMAVVNCLTKSPARLSNF